MSPATSRERFVSGQHRTDRVEPTNRSQPTKTMKKSTFRFPRLTGRRPSASAAVVDAIAGIGAGYLFRDRRLRQASQFLAVAQDRAQQRARTTATDDAHDEHDAHADHDQAGSAKATSFELSEPGQKNIGLRLVAVQPQDFDRTINVPAMVKERPGRTEIKVSAPMHRMVTRIYLIPGEAVTRGQPLFDLRLTHSAERQQVRSDTGACRVPGTALGGDYRRLNQQQVIGVPGSSGALLVVWHACGAAGFRRKQKGDCPGGGRR